MPSSYSFTSENRSHVTETLKGSEDVTGDATPGPSSSALPPLPFEVALEPPRTELHGGARLASWGLLEPVLAQPPPLSRCHRATARPGVLGHTWGRAAGLGAALNTLEHGLIRHGPDAFWGAVMRNPKSWRSLVSTSCCKRRGRTQAAPGGSPPAQPAALPLGEGGAQHESTHRQGFRAKQPPIQKRGRHLRRGRRLGPADRKWSSPPRRPGIW